MRKVLLLAVAGALVVPALAFGATFDLRHVDLSSYPEVRLTVYSPRPSAGPRVFENGRAVTSPEIQSLGQSKAIVLALDRSQSMIGRPLAAAAAAAESFLDRKRLSDKVAVVTFGPTAIAQTDFAQTTIDADTVLRNLSIDPIQGTALFDAVVLAAARLSRQPLTGRVLVLLTDGGDIGSVATLTNAVEAAQEAGVVVYAIGLGKLDPAPLERLTASTGGSLYLSPTPATLTEIYRRIAAEFGRTWRISYITSARPGETLTVAVGSPRAGGGSKRTLVVPGRPSVPNTGLLPRAVVSNLGVAAALSLLVGALLFGIARTLQALPRRTRIKRLVTAHTDLDARPRHKNKQRLTLAVVLAAIDRRLRGMHRWESVERLVERAALPVTAPVVLVGGFAIGLLAIIVTGAATGSVLLGVVAFPLGVVAPLLAVRVRAGRRVRAFDEQLPDALGTIASSLRVGHGLKAALQAVADEGASPARNEFRRVLSEARLGRPLEEALIGMCERLGSEDLLYVATAVDVQTHVGGSLAGVFNTVAETVRQRQQHRRKVRALTATGRTAAIVLSMLPVAFVVLMTAIDPDYMLPFLRSSIGQTMLVVAAISISIGAVLLNKIVNVKA